jgi:hypothetical protein
MSYEKVFVTQCYNFAILIKMDIFHLQSCFISEKPLSTSVDVALRQPETLVSGGQYRVRFLVTNTL